MEEKSHLSISTIMSLTHQSIGRGIHMSRLYSNIFGRVGFPEGKIRPGFVDYVRSLVTVMRAHHLAEERLVFPLLQEKSPEVPVGRLTAEHQDMGVLLDEIRIKAELMGDEASSRESLRRIESVVTSLADLWPPHVEAEDVHYSPPKLGEALTPEEQNIVAAQVAELNMEYSRPDYLVLPFTLFNLSPENRGGISEMMPPEVVQHLVPVAWKDKWKPMAPFLLV